jgi:isopenicillin-N epimerase
MTDPIHPARSPHASHWTLDPQVTFLNHGSFGAAPRVVQAAQDAWRARMESQPMRFFLRDLEGLLDAARAPLAALVHAPPSALAWVPNATTAVNAVLRSLPLAEGDELLTTDMAYNACRNVLDYVAARAGATVTVARLPFPVPSEEAVVDTVLAAVTPRTRLALLDHVTSPTGLVLPLAALCEALHRRGVEVLVDGAHAVGMVPLDLRALGVAYYTANCHKWLCTPKGAAFLYVREDKQREVRPATISHGANSTRTDRSRFLLEFDWTGTVDPTAYLCIPDALRFMEGLLPGGLAAVMAHNRALALEARAILCDALDAAPPAPASMIGSLAAVPLPDGPATCVPSVFGDPLQDVLLERYGIVVPIVPWPRRPKRLVRISAQLYNSRAEYQHLARALRAELASAG